jgi:hypothetical protein
MYTKTLLGLLLLSGTLSGCTTTEQPSGTASPTPVSESSPAAVVSATLAPRTVALTRTIENKDGSTTVATIYSDGTTSEERTFKSGPLSRATRTTNAEGQRTVRVTYRADAREVELQDESWADKAMDATGDALATAASKTKQGALEVGDKAEDVGAATKKGVKKGIREVGDKAEDVGGAVKKGAQKAGKKIGDIVH